MSRPSIAVVLAAFVLFAVAVVGALAFTGGDAGGGGVHTMPNGRTMSGMMDDSMSTGPMHTMPGAGQMPGMAHSP